VERTVPLCTVAERTVLQCTVVERIVLWCTVVERTVLHCKRSEKADTPMFFEMMELVKGTVLCCYTCSGEDSAPVHCSGEDSSLVHI